MGRRQFSRAFKVEAVKLVRERGVSVAQASRDLGFHVDMLRKWVRDHDADPPSAFPGHGQMKPEQLEIERLMRQQALKARPRRRGLPKDDGQRSVIAGNVLDRQFSAEAPNQK